MKKMKKLLAILLAAVMVMGMSLTTFAEGDGQPVTPTETTKKATGKEGDTGVITVNGIDAGSSVKVWAYPIIAADYSGPNGNFKGFKMVNEAYKIADIEAPTEAELAAIAQTISGLTNPARHELTSDGTSFKSQEIPVGMYLISVENADATAYSPAVASIFYKNESGDSFIIDSDDLGMGTINTISQPNTWVKKTSTPGLDKTVKKDGETGAGDNHNAASIGDTLVYTVTIEKIPYYSGKFPVLKVIDTLSKGLKYVDNSLTVVASDGTNKTVLTNKYDLTVSGQTITVDFAKGYNYQLNEYKGQSAVITYKAIVTKDAALNEISNNNDVVLKYTKNSLFETEDKDLPEEEKKTYTYTFDLDGVLTGVDKENKIDTTNIFNKVGLVTTVTNGTSTTTKTPLKGAKFGLYQDAAATQVYKADAADADKGQDYGNIVSDANGQLHITGLAAGTYYLKEISAPEKYSINGDIFQIDIITDEWEEDGRLKTWSVKFGIVGQTSVLAAKFGITYDGTTKEVEGATKTETIKDDDASFDGYNIVNTHLTALPSTGGIGTTIFTIGGCAIMVIAAGLFFATRRKSVK